MVIDDYRCSQRIDNCSLEFKGDWIVVVASVTQIMELCNMGNTLRVIRISCYTQSVKVSISFSFYVTENSIHFSLLLNNKNMKFS